MSSRFKNSGCAKSGGLNLSWSVTIKKCTTRWTCNSSAWTLNSRLKHLSKGGWWKCRMIRFSTKRSNSGSETSNSWFKIWSKRLFWKSKSFIITWSHQSEKKRPNSKKTNMNSHKAQRKTIKANMTLKNEKQTLTSKRYEPKRPN